MPADFAHLPQSGDSSDPSPTSFSDPYFYLSASPDRLNQTAGPGDYIRYLADLTAAIQTFHDPLSPAQVLSLVRLWTMVQSVHARAMTGRQQDVIAREIYLANNDPDTLLALGREQDAFDIIRLIPEVEYRVNALLSVYGTLADQSRLTSSRLEEACELARTLPDESKALALVRLACLWLPIDSIRAESLLAEGLTSAFSIQALWERIDSLIDIARLIIDWYPQRTRDLLDEALTLTRRQTDGYNGPALDYRAIAVVMAKLDRDKAAEIFQEALTAASMITEEEAYHGVYMEVMTPEEELAYLRGVVRDRIIESQIQTRIISPYDVLEMVQSAENNEKRFWLLTFVVPVLIQIGDTHVELRLAEMEAIARNFDGGRQVRAIRTIQNLCLQAGYYDRAWQIAQAASSADKTFERLESLVRTLGGLPGDYLINYMRDALDETLVAVQEFYNKLPRPPFSASQEQDRYRTIVRTNLVMGMGHILARIQDERAPQVLEDAAAITDNRPSHRSPRYLKETQRHFIIALIDAGHLRIAQRMLADTDEADQIGILLAQLEALIALADPRATETLENVLRVIRTENERDQVGALLTVVETLGNSQDRRSIDLIDETLAIARKLQNQNDSDYGDSGIRFSARALAQIAGTLGLIGDPRAEQIFSEAFEVAANIREVPRRTETLSSFVRSLMRADRVDEALALAFSLAGTMNAAMSVSDLVARLADRGEVDQVREVIRRIADQGQFNDLHLASYPIIALARAGQYEAAQFEMQGKRFESWEHNHINDAIATALATDEKLAQGFEQLTAYNFELFVKLLVEWTPIFENIQPGLSIEVMREATRIWAWLEPGWLPLHNLLTASTVPQSWHSDRG